MMSSPNSSLYAGYDLNLLIEQLQERHVASEKLGESLLLLEYTCPKVGEIAKHGVIRRLNLLDHLAHKIFETIAPNEAEPSRASQLDVTAFLQAFIFNIFGTIDNLAWLWTEEKALRKSNGQPLSAAQIGLYPRKKYTIVRDSLPPAIEDYLENANEWSQYLANYRHALAHRIPLYIPPKRLSAHDREAYAKSDIKIREAFVKGDPKAAREELFTQSQFGSFHPVMMHSFLENAQPVMFHGQIICDLWTVHEITSRFLDTL